MSLFYNPQKSGRGVSKEEATKTEMKPFFKFFDIFGRKFWYIMQLNALYLVLCLPVITIGPATAALVHVMRKFVLEEPIFVFAEFFDAFKRHFKRTAALGVLSLIFTVGSIVSIVFYAGLAVTDPKTEHYFLMAMGMIAGAVFFTMNIYIYPQIISLNLSMSDIVKNAARFCLIGFKRNVVAVMLSVTVFILMAWFFPFSLIALPLAPIAQLAFLCVFNAYPVIQRYVINPFYEAQGQKNPELPDYSENDEKAGDKSTIFTDLGGQEVPVNKKNVKTTGKIIK
jgi:uncharacterized membrane protein YesL